MQTLGKGSPNTRDELGTVADAGIPNPGLKIGNLQMSFHHRGILLDES